MTDKPVEYRPYSRFEEGYEDLPLDADEIEVRLAIADFVIRRVAGTPDGEQIFNALIRRFENRYPHHKLLSHYLTSPEYLVPEVEDIEPEDEEVNRLCHNNEEQDPGELLADLDMDSTSSGKHRGKH
ncbi:hypothetical protein D3C77_259320 [compost metagenome]